MAITFQGKDASDIYFGLVQKIFVQPAGGSFLDIGYIDDSSTGSLIPITKRGDPSDTDIVVGIRCDAKFNGLQTAKAVELANFSTGGFFTTDAAVRFSFAGLTRSFTIGEETGYPMRLIGSVYMGDINTAPYIEYSITGVIPYTLGYSNLFTA